MDIDILNFENVSSTNLLAEKFLIDRNLKDNTAIFADFQASGKGQQNNIWHSEKGENILVSFVLFPVKLNIESFFVLNQLASLAIISSLKELLPEPELKIKWPNDILFKKMKISGILIQNNIEGNFIKNTIIGIGINVNQTDFPDLEVKATSVKNQTVKNYSMESLKQGLITNMLRYFEMINNESYHSLCSEYLKYLYMYKKHSKFYNEECGTFNAQIDGVEKDGRLVLKTDAGIKKYYFKEVSFIL